MASLNLSALVNRRTPWRRFGWAALLALALSLALGAVAFSKAEGAKVLKSALGLGAGSTAPTAGGRAPLWSAPDFAFSDQHGAPVTRASLRGRVWIANFIFTRCRAACPLLTSKMRLLQRKLSYPELRFLSFSVDPAEDSVEVLRRYADGWAKDETRWHLLRTEPSPLRNVLDGMRVVIAPSADPANPIIHTSLFFLVDGAGRVRGQYDSHDARALARLVDDTRALLQASVPGPNAALGSDKARVTGKQHFDALGCAGCHEKSEIAPSLAGIWGKEVTFADGTRARVDASYIRESLLEPAKKVLAGHASTMPSYAGELSEGELTELVEYVRSLTPAP